jgi:hypothetical protein
MLRTNSEIRSIIFALSVCLSATVLFSSCASNESKAKKAIQEYLKNQGVTDLTMDSFFTSSSVPGKAYTSATVTYNFATSDGKPQREFLGFILAQEGSGWRIERNVGYTKEEQQAIKILSGQK